MIRDIIDPTAGPLVIGGAYLDSGNKFLIQAQYGDGSGNFWNDEPTTSENAGYYDGQENAVWELRYNSAFLSFDRPVMPNGSEQYLDSVNIDISGVFVKFKWYWTRSNPYEDTVAYPMTELERSNRSCVLNLGKNGKTYGVGEESINITSDASQLFDVTAIKVEYEQEYFPQGNFWYTKKLTTTYETIFPDEERAPKQESDYWNSGGVAGTAIFDVTGLRKFFT